jgi:hypothetical protein
VGAGPYWVKGRARGWTGLPSFGHMTSPVCTRTHIDPRGPRVGASITSLVLVAAIVLISTPVGVGLVAWQTLVFGLGAVVGLHAQPYGIVYRTLIQPRLARPSVLEDAAGPRFAQAVGFTMLVIALVAEVAGLTLAATIVLALALAAAFLNAAFGLCLGCEMRLVGLRVLSR